ncbi:SLC13 family permease [Lysobacter sp. TY2-98]|uniref:SLC13 family permease n=1 Tax=Lysobacter sp. TY2-98 TaxID=2290922 RepID=UPI000E20811F|nr:SLC13 family permease [Lysobacter sp. TY2-98]AXK71308.1 SLC13 family permease [Lysobacter sp. TY2-98]
MDDTALPLTQDMVVVLAIAAFTMVMFLFERIRADVVALVVLVLLGLTGLVDPESLFNGFAGNAVISVMGTMILGAGLDRTGAVNRLAAWLLRRAHGDEKRLMLLTTMAAGINSPLMQNPSVMALYMPVAARLSSRTGLPLSKFLMPIAAAIVMGGGLTMVGNSPLILLNDLLVAANANLPSGAATLQPLKMFAPMPIGLALLAASIAYFHYYGSRKLPDAEGKGATPGRTQSYFADAYGINGDVYELTVAPDSALAGLTVGEAEKLLGAPLLLALKNGEESRLAPPADSRIAVGSVLGVMGSEQQVSDFAQRKGLKVSSRLDDFADTFNPARSGISEAVVPAISRYIGRTAGELQLRRRYGVSLLAINRDKEVIRDDVRDVPLRSGDMLVLHSLWSDLPQLTAQRDLVVVTDYPKAKTRPHKLKAALVIFAITMLLALSSRLPVPIAMMTGVAGMLIAGVIDIDEAYAAISWKTVFLMACLIPLGWAMDSSGAAAWLAGHTIALLPEWLPAWVLQIFIALGTTAFSIAIGNVGATIVVVPLAINLALAVGGNPTAFALTVALAASNNFLTPSNAIIPMITGPAGYTPRDLWRVGGPLTLIYTAVTVLMINLLF